MKLLSCYTPSHQVFLRSFFGSMQNNADLDVIIRQHPQECPTGAFADEGWNATTKRKFEFLLEYMGKMDEGEIGIFSDVDVQFFGVPLAPLATKALDQGLDLAFQNDYYGHACTGFFFFRNIPIIREFFQLVTDNIHKYRDDQDATNNYLKAAQARIIKYGLLPPQFFTFGSFFKHWDGETNFRLPHGMVMHHANWVKGVDKKIELLKVVRNLHNAQQ